MVCQVSGDAYWFQSFDFWARVGSLNPTWPLVNSRMRLSPQDSTWNSRHQKLLQKPSLNETLVFSEYFLVGWTAERGFRPRLITKLSVRAQRYSIRIVFEGFSESIYEHSDA